MITQSRMVITSRVDESHYEKITPYIAQKMLYWHCGKSIKIIPHFGINWAKTAGPIFPKCGIIMIFFAAMSAPHFLSQCAADIFPQNGRSYILEQNIAINTYIFRRKMWVLIEIFWAKCNICHFWWNFSLSFSHNVGQPQHYGTKNVRRKM